MIKHYLVLVMTMSLFILDLQLKFFRQYLLLYHQIKNFLNLLQEDNCIKLFFSSRRTVSFKRIREMVKYNKFKKIFYSVDLTTPLNKKQKERILRSNKNKHELHNNCSGKHLAMITSCIMKNYDTKNYLSFESPVSEETIRKTFEKFFEKKNKKKSIWH